MTTCQICGREIQAKKGLIAHHGYRRPQDRGFQTASCLGARHVPYEVSNARIPEVIKLIEAWMYKDAQTIANMIANPPETVTGSRRIKGMRVPVQIARPDDFKADRHPASFRQSEEYAIGFWNRINQLKANIATYESEIPLLQVRFDAWAPAAEVGSL